ncbi:MAG: hypothetical protein ACREU7_01910, partial [Burkholderiales bacterium]
YLVAPGTGKFEKRGFEGVGVLIVANAAAPNATAQGSGPAFSEAECDAVRDWVRQGGSLLLIADHAPYGRAEALAARFGVEMGKGFVLDRANSEAGPTLLVFSRENGLLGDHSLLRGRDASEEIKRVIAFTGQSLTVPPGAVRWSASSKAGRRKSSRWE